MKIKNDIKWLKEHRFITEIKTPDKLDDDNKLRKYTTQISVGSGLKYYYHNEYLTFEALEDGTFSFSKDGLSYSLDNGTTWNALRAGSSTPTVNAGSKVLWKGSYHGTSTSNYACFGSTGKFNVSGNIMSLMFGDDFKDKTDLGGYSYCFYRLFYNLTKLVDASNLTLPAATLVPSCYQYMFSGCTALIKTPKLPATTLAQYCYSYMFSECTSLTTSPELPATTLAQCCYQYMFSGCTKLTTAPELSTTILADYCYAGMFRRCTSLTTVPVLPATTLTQSCYAIMFSNCTSLTTAPELPTTTLALNCYDNMFSQCTSLTTAPELPATTLAGNCYINMFSNCTSLTTAPELPATTLASSCYSYMFQNCTSLTTAPELPATTLASSCYSYMFQNCSKLKHIKAMFTTTPTSYYTNGWVSGVSSYGTFVKNSAATWNVTGNDGVPSGWTIVTADA